MLSIPPTDAATINTACILCCCVEKSFLNCLFSFLFKDVGENWQNRSFDWTEYLKKTGAKAAASHLFEHVRMIFMSHAQNVNSVYSQLSPCGHPTIMDAHYYGQNSDPCRGLTESDSWYYGLSPFRTQNNVPKVSAITRVDCRCFIHGF